MRICIAGGGLAGTLLAWRLAQNPDVRRIDLLAGGQGNRDATGVSGGVVRGYEPARDQRTLALDSLAELRASTVLRRWSAYKETGSVYLRACDPSLVEELQEIEAALPCSVQLAEDAELSERGFVNLPAGTAGVIERYAGYLSPSRLRAALIRDLIARPRVTVSIAPLSVVRMRGDGTVRCTTPSRGQAYDIAVMATGAWTPGLLVRNGFECPGFRTKSIQYSVYAVRGKLPPPFVDETTGLYGRPIGGGRLLLGVATEDWDVPPGTRPVNTHLQRHAARLAETRLGGLAVLAPLASVNAGDCYCDPPLLALRAVPGCAGAVRTFTGGSGGSVKTALAASRQAAERLVAQSQGPDLLTSCQHRGKVNHQ